jgi:hypothetical protein
MRCDASGHPIRCSQPRIMNLNGRYPVFQPDVLQLVSYKHTIQTKIERILRFVVVLHKSFNSIQLTRASSFADSELVLRSERGCRPVNSTFVVARVGGSSDVIAGDVLDCRSFVLFTSSTSPLFGWIARWAPGSTPPIRLRPPFRPYIGYRVYRNTIPARIRTSPNQCQRPAFPSMPPHHH